MTHKRAPAMRQIRTGHRPKSRRGPTATSTAHIAARGGSRPRHRTTNPGSTAVHRGARECGGVAGGGAGQQTERMRRIGVLIGNQENDPLGKPRLSAFPQALADLGWTDGCNVRMDPRWGGADIDRIRALAQELVGLHPDVILTGGTPMTIALQRETRTIPIVFANVGDPVASSIVARLDRPTGNITGFATYEATLGGKWLELLSEIALGLRRAAIMFNPDTFLVSTYMPSIETAAGHSRSRQ